MCSTTNNSIPCNSYTELEGDLIQLALAGKFDVIAHGCNCFCIMGGGIAPQMAKAFGCDKFPMERTTNIETFYDGEDLEHVEVPNTNKGNIHKLGQIEYQLKYLWFNHPNKENQPSIAMNHMSMNQKDIGYLYVVNCYTQYGPGFSHSKKASRPLSYEALTLCLQKLNHTFPGKHIGLPRIGAGLAEGNWEYIKSLIQENLTDMQVTVINYKPNEQCAYIQTNLSQE